MVDRVAPITELPQLEVTPEEVVPAREPSEAFSGLARRRPVPGEEQASYSTADLNAALERPMSIDDMIPDADQLKDQMSHTAVLMEDARRASITRQIGRTFNDQIKERATQLFKPDERFFDPDALTSVQVAAEYFRRADENIFDKSWLEQHKTTYAEEVAKAGGVFTPVDSIFNASRELQGFRRGYGQTIQSIGSAMRQFLHDYSAEEIGKAVEKYGAAQAGAVPEQPKMLDIKSVKEAADWFRDAAGSGVGSSVPAIVPGIIGGAAAGWWGGVAASGAVTQAMGIGQMRMALEQEQAKLRGQAELARERGEHTAARMFEQQAGELDPNNHMGTVLGFGAIIGFVEQASLMFELRGSDAMLKAARKELADRAIVHLVKRSGQGALSEGMEEVIQDYAEAMGIAQAQGISGLAGFWHAVEVKKWQDVVEAFGAGAAGGSALGAGGAAKNILAGQRQEKLKQLDAAIAAKDGHGAAAIAKDLERLNKQRGPLVEQGIEAAKRQILKDPTGDVKRLIEMERGATQQDPGPGAEADRLVEAEREGFPNVVEQMREDKGVPPAEPNFFDDYEQGPNTFDHPTFEQERIAFDGMLEDSAADFALKEEAPPQDAPIKDWAEYFRWVEQQAENEQDRLRASEMAQQLEMAQREAQLARHENKVQGAEIEALRQQVEAGQDIAKQVGAAHEIVTPDGSMTVNAKTEVVEASDLKFLSGDLQPAERTREGSQAFVADQAANHDFTRVMPGRTSDQGAPVVTGDGTVASGNRRVQAILEMYRNPALKAQALAYRNSLGAAARGMQQPVVISRIGNMEQAELTKFAELSNRPGLTMPAAEQAKHDAKIAGPKVMSRYHGGAYTAEHNLPFYHGFINSVVTTEGEERMTAALLAAAYEDTELLATLAKSKDESIRSLLGAMKDAAGAFVRMKEAVAEGVADKKFDITKEVVAVAQHISELRNKGVTSTEFLARPDAFAQVDPIVEALLRRFYGTDLAQPLSQQKLTEFLIHYADEAAKRQAETPGRISEHARQQAARSDSLAERLARSQSDVLGGSPSVSGGSAAGLGGEVSGSGAVEGGADITEASLGAFRAYIEHGGSVARGDFGRIAEAVGIAEERLPELLERAVEDGTIRKDSRGRYRRPASDDGIQMLAAIVDGREQRRSFDALGFYSRLLETAKGMKQAKGSVEQMFRLLTESPGIKDAEVIATGLDAYLLGEDLAKQWRALVAERNSVAGEREEFMKTLPKLERADGESNKDWSARRKAREAEIDKELAPLQGPYDEHEKAFRDALKKAGQSRGKGKRHGALFDFSRAGPEVATAEEGGSQVTYARSSNPDEYYVGVVWTEPGSRRRGRSRALMQKLVEHADAENKSLRLMGGDEEGIGFDNLRGFYRSLGFEEIGEPIPARGAVPEHIEMVRPARDGSQGQGRVDPEIVARIYDATTPLAEMKPETASLVREYADRLKGRSTFTKARPSSVAKADIVEYLTDNRVKILETFYAGEPVRPPQDDTREEALDRARDIVRQNFLDDSQIVEELDDDAYSEALQEEIDSNYDVREVDPEEIKKENRDRQIVEIAARLDAIGQRGDDGIARYERYAGEEAELRKELAALENPTQPDPNQLALDVGEAEAVAEPEPQWAIYERTYGHGEQARWEREGSSPLYDSEDEANEKVRDLAESSLDSDAGKRYYVEHAGEREDYGYESESDAEDARDQQADDYASAEDEDYLLELVDYEEPDEEDDVDLPTEHEGAAGPLRHRQYNIEPNNPTNKESVIHLPQGRAAPAEVLADLDRLNREIAGFFGPWGANLTEEQNKALRLLEVERNTLKRIIEKYDYDRSHWAETPNVVAHARTFLARDPNGAATFVNDEWQADPAQRARKEGIQDQAKIDKLQSQSDEITLFRDSLQKEIGTYERYEQVPFGFNRPLRPDAADRAIAWLNERRGGDVQAAYGYADPVDYVTLVRDMHERVLEDLGKARAAMRAGGAYAELIKTTDQWVNTLARRMIRQAVEAGADRIAMAPGKVHNLRWSKGWVVDELVFARYPADVAGGNFGTLTGRPQGAAYDSMAEVMRTRSDLDALIGKELADRLLATPDQLIARPGETNFRPPVTGHFLGDLNQLEVGGQGFKRTYDEIYPRALEKILKKLDPSIKYEAMPLVSPSTGVQYSYTNAARTPIVFHTFKLTPKAQNAVITQGLEMFAAMPQAPKLRLPAGLTHTEHENAMGQINIAIMRGTFRKKQVGRIYVRQLRGPSSGQVVALQIGNISLDESIQRQGVATAVTDYLEAKYRKPVVPDVTMSDAEYARWKKKDPEAVRGYTRMPGAAATWTGDPLFHNNYLAKRQAEISARGNMPAALRPEATLAPEDEKGSAPPRKRGTLGATKKMQERAEADKQATATKEALAAPVPVSKELAAWTGLKEGALIDLDAQKLWEKRLKEPHPDWDTVEATRATAEDILANAAFAHFHQAGNWNLIRVMPDGSHRNLAIDPVIKVGDVYHVRTGFTVQLRDQQATRVWTTVRSFEDADPGSGLSAVKWKPDHQAVGGLADLITRANHTKTPEMTRVISALRAEQARLRANRPAAGRGRPSWATQEALVDLGEEIKALAEKIVPSDVSVFVDPFVFIRGMEARGRYNPLDRLIEIATAYGREEALRTLIHEAGGHALRGVYTGEEWAILLDAAKRYDVDTKMPSPVPGIAGIEGYRKFYSDMLVADGLKPGTPEFIAQLEDMLNQERVAYLAEEWLEGTKFGEKADSLFERLLRFIEAVWNALRQRGFDSHRDIFERVMEGKYAERANRQAKEVEAEQRLRQEILDNLDLLAISPKGRRLGATGTAAQWINRNERNVPDWPDIFRRGLEALKSDVELKFQLATTPEALDEIEANVDLKDYLERQANNPGQANPEVQEALRRYRRDPEGAARVINEHVGLERRRVLETWLEYLTDINAEYEADPFWKDFIWEGLTKGLRKDAPNLPPPLLPAALADTYADVMEDPDTRNFMTIYSEMAAEQAIAETDAKNQVKTKAGKTWVKVPKTESGHRDFAKNAAQIRALSCKTWCTAGSMAEVYLKSGDFWMLTEDGETQMAIRFKDNEVAEIQGPANDGKIPLNYVDDVKELSESGKIELGGRAKSALTKAIKRAAELASVDKLIKEGRFLDAFLELGVDVLPADGGGVIIQHNNLVRHLNDLTPEIKDALIGQIEEIEATRYDAISDERLQRIAKSFPKLRRIVGELNLYGSTDGIGGVGAGEERIDQTKMFPKLEEVTFGISNYASADAVKDLKALRRAWSGRFAQLEIPAQLGFGVVQANALPRHAKVVKLSSPRINQRTYDVYLQLDKVAWLDKRMGEQPAKVKKVMRAWVKESDPDYRYLSDAIRHVYNVDKFAMGGWQRVTKITDVLERKAGRKLENEFGRLWWQAAPYVSDETLAGLGWIRYLDHPRGHISGMHRFIRAMGITVTELNHLSGSQIARAFNEADNPPSLAFYPRLRRALKYYNRIDARRSEAVTRAEKQLAALKKKTGFGTVEEALQKKAGVKALVMPIRGQRNKTTWHLSVFDDSVFSVTYPDGMPVTDPAARKAVIAHVLNEKPPGDVTMLAAFRSRGTGETYEPSIRDRIIARYLHWREKAFPNSKAVGAGGIAGPQPSAARFIESRGPHAQKADVLYRDVLKLAERIRENAETFLAQIGRPVPEASGPFRPGRDSIVSRLRAEAATGSSKKTKGILLNYAKQLVDIEATRVRAHNALLDALSQPDEIGPDSAANADMRRPLSREEQEGLNALLDLMEKEGHGPVMAAALRPGHLPLTAAAAAAADAQDLPMDRASRLARALAQGFDIARVWYHGTTHNFKAFDPTRMSPENFLGQAIYLTSDHGDAGTNYTGKGPDMSRRIEFRAEEIFQEMFKDEQEPQYNTPAYERAMKRAMAKARKELVGEAGPVGVIMPVYVRPGKMLDLTDKGKTYFDFRTPEKFNEETQEYEFTGEENEQLAALYDALRRFEAEFQDVEADKVITELDAEGLLYDEVKAQDFAKRLRNSSLMYASDNTGKLVGSELERRIYEAMGYDSVLINARDQFSNMNLAVGTEHLMVFHPENVRSVNAAFDPAENNSAIVMAAARRPQRPAPITGVNAIIRNLIEYLGLDVRQGMNTHEAKQARMMARRAGIDLDQYYSRRTGKLLRAQFYDGMNAIRGIAEIGADAVKARVPGVAAAIAKYADELIHPFSPTTAPTPTGTQLLLQRSVEAELKLRAHAAEWARRRPGASRNAYDAAHQEAVKARNALAGKVGEERAKAMINEIRSGLGGDLPVAGTVTPPSRLIGYMINRRIDAKGVALTPTHSAEDIDRGYREFFKNYIGSRDGAAARFPEFMEAFEEILDEGDHGLLERLQAVQRDIATYRAANPMQIIASMVVDAKTKTRWARFREDQRKFGLPAAIGMRLSNVYTNYFDETNPFYVATRELLRIHLRNTGQKIMLPALSNPWKLLRRSYHAHAWATRDMEEGIRPYRGSIDPEGPGLIGALVQALGPNRGTAMDTAVGSKYRDFGAYLVGRYLAKEWEKRRDGKKEKDPATMQTASHAEEIAFYQKARADFEAKYPEFVGAANMIYDYQQNLLKLQRDGGLISTELYDELIQDREYVPMMRSFEEEGEDLSLGNTLSSGKSGILKKKRGSNRDVIDPIASIAQKTFETRRILALNDTKKTLRDLIVAAGPGGGIIGEEIDTRKLKPNQIDIHAALKAAAKEAGLDVPTQATLTQLARELLDNDATATVFTTGLIDDGKGILFFFEDGEVKALQLAEGRLAQQLFLALEKLGKETFNLLAAVAAVPSQFVRAGVVTHPEFMFANTVRDAAIAFMWEPRAIPFWTQLRGAASVVAGSQNARSYYAYGGMMGGEATSALDNLRLERDVKGLIERGYKFKLIDTPANWASFLTEMISARNWKNRLTGGAFGVLSGAGTGAIFGGLPGAGVGAVVGGVAGMVTGGKTLIKIGEGSETATRTELFRHAFNRAKENGLDDVTAVQEAAFWAHDYTDYSRHGSKMVAIARAIPFLNANLQGNDSYIRRLMGKGDYGYNNIFTYMAYRTGMADFSNLTERERRDLGLSAWTWFLTVFGVGGISFVLSTMFGDDERMKEIPQEMRANHWIVPVGDTNYMARIPKPFQTSWAANLIERVMIDARNGNSRWFENWMADLYTTWKPPLMLPAVDIVGALAGFDLQNQKSITPKWKEGTTRVQEYDEYSSEFAKWAAKKTDVMSPFYIDFLIHKVGASWGRTLTQSNFEHLPWYNPNEAEKGLDEQFILRRFLWRVGKGSEAGQAMRRVMGGENPIDLTWIKLATPYANIGAKAEAYDEMLRRPIPDVVGAMAELETMTPAQRGFAILKHHFEKDDAKYRLLHPMQRGETVVRDIIKIQKEIVSDQLTSDRKTPLQKPLPMTPSEKLAAGEILTQIQMMEAHNALVLFKEKGWENRQLFDTKSVYAELKAAVPKVAKELDRRLSKDHVPPFAGVARVWPDVQRKIESDAVYLRVKNQKTQGMSSMLAADFARAMYGGRDLTSEPAALP